MFNADLSQLFPWMLAIFIVLGLIACCAWFYKCLQKCNDRCSLLRTQHSLSHGAQQSSSRADPHQDFYQVGTFRSRPAGASMHMATSSFSSPLGAMRESYAYRTPFALKTHFSPYSHLPPPPSYDEAMAAPDPSPNQVSYGMRYEHRTQRDVEVVVENPDATTGPDEEEDDDFNRGMQDDRVQLTGSCSQANVVRETM
ncbi:uncharacterized protein [Diadema setosum]|uniref:uncharacterized protein n=1 Tax=Diadema setosum TaxID=31175 RepID=UPI003B3BC3A9